MAAPGLEFTMLGLAWIDMHGLILLKKEIGFVQGIFRQHLGKVSFTKKM